MNPRVNNPDLQLTMASPRDVAFGRMVDEQNAREQKAAQYAHPLAVARRRADQAEREARYGIAPTLSDASGFITREQRDKDFKRRMELGMVAAPAAGVAAGLGGLYAGPLARLVVEGTKSIPAIASMAGVGAGTELLEDKPTALGAAAKAAQWAAMTRMPISEALGYVGDAEAASLYSSKPFLKYIAERFPEMLAPVRGAMKHTAQYGTEAAVHGVQDPNMRIMPLQYLDDGSGEMVPYLEGVKNSVHIPPEIRSKVIASPNGFDFHTHPRGGSGLPSNPVNNASQNPLGGDTQYYSLTPKGLAIRNPGKIDNLIAAVQSRADRDSIDHGSGEAWSHMKMQYPDPQAFRDMQKYLLDNNQNRDLLKGLENNPHVDEDYLSDNLDSLVNPKQLGTFALLRHFADTGRGDFTYNMGKSAIGPGGRAPMTPIYEQIYDNIRKSRQLRNYAGGGKVGALGRIARRLTDEPVMRGTTEVIKEKGGNWLSGSVEGALSGLKKPEGTYYAAADLINAIAPEARTADQVRYMKQFESAQPINTWIDKQLTNYVRNEMATPQDPVRALAERGVLHFNPADIRESRMQVHPSGEELTKLGQSEAAQGWENLSDRFIYPNLAGDIKYSKAIKDNPWLESVKVKAPATPVYSRSSLDGSSGQLGFDHLIDELSSAINPESGLPRELLLKADSLNKVSVPQAVERVALINAWRTEQARLADLEKMKANLLAKPHKQFENGWRWAELPDANTPEGKKLVQDIGCQGGWCTQTEGNALGYGAHDKGNKLYGLIDPDGRPHVQIHVAQEKSYGSDHLNAQRPQAEQEALEQGLDPDRQAYQSFVANRMTELANASVPPRIKQIKPFSNSWDSEMVRDFTKKNPNYRKEIEPMIQDFVKSGQWSDVGDLGNTGLRRSRDVFNELEAKTLKEKGHDFGEYLTPEDMTRLHEVWNTWPKTEKARMVDSWAAPEEMAEGGSVTPNKIETAEQLQGIINALKAQGALA